MLLLSNLSSAPQLTNFHRDADEARLSCFCSSIPMLEVQKEALANRTRQRLVALREKEGARLLHRQLPDAG